MRSKTAVHPDFLDSLDGIVRLVGWSVVMVVVLCGVDERPCLGWTLWVGETEQDDYSQVRANWTSRSRVSKSVDGSTAGWVTKHELP